MVLSRYLSREILYTLIALLIMLLLIFISAWFIRYLGQASAGDLPAEFIFQLLALKMVSIFSILLPLAFFLAILLALGRLYADNEMTAMAACGIGIPFVLRRVFGLGVATALVVGLFSLLLSPWAEEKKNQLQNDAIRLAEITGIAAGRFQDFQQGRSVFYAERVLPQNGTLEGVFIATESNQRKIIVASRQAYQHTDPANGARMVVLANGERYEGTPGSADFSVTHFEKASFRLVSENGAPSKIKLAATGSLELWESPNLSEQAELQIRLSAPLGVLLLAPLAALMAHSSPRRGRYAKVFIAVLVYFVYHNLLRIAEKWLERGQVPLEVGVWWVHGLLLLAVLALLLRRLRVTA
jgi:lipopolysaccharide export system permease protein